MSTLITLPWQFRVNARLAGTPTAGVFPPQYLIASYAQNTLWYVKESLKGQGSDWTSLLGTPATPSGNWGVYFSCNSVTAGVAGDGVDRWVAPTNLVSGSGANVRSWIVLSQPGIAPGYQLCISLESPNPYEATIAVSPNAGFTGGATNARPTALDEIVLLNVASFGPSTSPRDVTRVHVMKSADGSATRVLFARCGYISGLWMFERPSRPIVNWDNPSISYISVASASRPLASQLTQTTLNSQFNAKGRSRNYPNGVAFGCSLSVDYTNGVSPSGAPIPNEIDGTTPFYPIDLINVATFGARGRNGAMQDAWYIPWNFMDGTAIPDDDTRQYVLVGLLAMPWNRSAGLWH